MSPTRRKTAAVEVPPISYTRSGDVAISVGCAAEHIKIGSITQSERLAKYNRLLEIERELT